MTLELHVGLRAFAGRILIVVAAFVERVGSFGMMSHLLVILLVLGIHVAQVRQLESQHQQGRLKRLLFLYPALLVRLS
jgi:hypothetical protein